MSKKINEPATHSKNKANEDLHRRINKFQKCYQPRINLIMDENGDLLADSHSILNRWSNNSSRLLNLHRVSNIEQGKYIYLSH
jgi:hypothetical protein